MNTDVFILNTVVFVQVGPIKDIDKLKSSTGNQYSQVIDEQALWAVGPSGSTATFVKHEAAATANAKGLGGAISKKQEVDVSAIAKKKHILEKDHPASIHPGSLQH